MEIKTRKQLDFFIAADLMMNRGIFKRTFRRRIYELFFPDYIMEYIRCMRKYSFYKYKMGGGNYQYFPLYFFHRLRFRKLGIKLGFNIGENTFDYGLIIGHYGTVIVGATNRIGKYCVIHSSTCITDNAKIIGDGFYCSTGVKVTSKLTLGNNISVGANSLVNKTFIDNNCLIAGMPAIKIKDSAPWYVRDGWNNKVLEIEQLKKQMNI